MRKLCDPVMYACRCVLPVADLLRYFGPLDSLIWILYRCITSRHVLKTDFRMTVMRCDATRHGPMPEKTSSPCAALGAYKPASSPGITVVQLSFDSVALAVLPARPPALLPSIAVESTLAQLDIDRVMRLAHPSSELSPVADSRLMALLHPVLEVACAHPARIHLSKQ